MKNDYERGSLSEQQEARDLAILSLLLPEKGAEAFDEAWELIDLAAEFLNEKKAVREAGRKAYWESPEGIALLEQRAANFERMRERRESMERQESQSE